MAERVGFEPTNELPHCWFSRPVLSPLSHLSKILLFMNFNIFFINLTQQNATSTFINQVEHDGLSNEILFILNYTLV